MTGASILVADGDESSGRFLRRFLTNEGHHVLVVQSENAALDACATDPPDVVLIDLVEPEGHGFEVCRKLKEQPATRLIPVVIVTAQGDRADRLRGIEAGADDFLTKPFDIEELQARVRSLLRLKRYTDELDSAESIILSLSLTIEARDAYTEGHCNRLARYATAAGNRVRLTGP